MLEVLLSKVLIGFRVQLPARCSAEAGRLQLGSRVLGYRQVEYSIAQHAGTIADSILCSDIDRSIKHPAKPIKKTLVVLVVSTPATKES